MGLQNESFDKNPRNPHLKRINDLITNTPNDERGISNILSIMKSYGYIEPKFICEYGFYKVTLYNKTIFDFFTGSITIKTICDYCKEPRSREELYNHFYPNGKSTPYYFMHKYIEPLINQELLAYTMDGLKRSKNQKIIYNINKNQQKNKNNYQKCRKKLQKSKIY